MPAEPMAPAQLAPVLPPPPMASADLIAIADGAVLGTITFDREGDAVRMVGGFHGLAPGNHAFYIHAGTDCGRKGKNAGKHLDPTKAKHGPPASSERHAGDLGNLVVDAAGDATFAMTTDSVMMGDGRPDSILGRAIVIHAQPDDKRGDCGAIVACRGHHAAVARRSGREPRASRARSSRTSVADAGRSPGSRCKQSAISASTAV